MLNEIDSNRFGCVVLSEDTKLELWAFFRPVQNYDEESDFSVQRLVLTTNGCSFSLASFPEVVQALRVLEPEFGTRPGAYFRKFAEQMEDTCRIIRYFCPVGRPVVGVNLGRESCVTEDFVEAESSEPRISGNSIIVWFAGVDYTEKGARTTLSEVECDFSRSEIRVVRTLRAPQ